MVKMPLPILYSFRRCPYAMRARLAIAAAGVECELREIVLRDKAAEFLALSPKATVPVMQTPAGQVIDESLDIMLWALGQADPQGWMTPDGAKSDQMMALILRADTEFKPNLDRYKYASRHSEDVSSEARDLAGQFLMHLNDLLAGTGYLFGKHLSLADMAIAPFVRQFANVDRQWFDAQHWPHLLAWLERFLNSAAFLSIMQKYPKWQAGDALTLFPEKAANAP